MNEFLMIYVTDISLLIMINNALNECSYVFIKKEEKLLSDNKNKIKIEVLFDFYVDYEAYLSEILFILFDNIDKWLLGEGFFTYPFSQTYIKTLDDLVQLYQIMFDRKVITTIHSDLT